MSNYVKLLDIVSQITSGATPESGSARYYTEDDGIKFAKTEDLSASKSRYIEETGLKVKEIALRETSLKIYPKDTILVSMYGTIGLTKIVKEPLAANQALCALIPPFKCDIEYLYYYLTSLKSEWTRLSAQTTQANINGEIVKNKEIWLPELSKQKEIAKILTKIDGCIETSNSTLDKLQNIKAGLLNDLLTRGVDSQGNLRPGYEDAPDLYQETGLGFIPKEWEIIKLDEISEKVTDGTHQAVTTIPLNHEGVPFLFVSCVKEGKILWNKAGKISRRDYQELSKGREPKKGMIIYTVVGSYGDAAALADDREVAFQRNTACIYPNTKLISSDFLVSYLNSESVRKHADRVALGNAQKLITLGELKKYLVALPPLQEQKLIEEKLKVVTDNISFEKENLDKLMLIKTGLLKDLLQN